MALKIIDSCVNCHACEPLCPSNAISAGPQHFLIDQKACTECDGDFAAPQCAAICPVEGAILDAVGDPMNPLGTLTGIPPEVWVAYQEAEAAR